MLPPDVVEIGYPSYVLLADVGPLNLLWLIFPLPLLEVICNVILLRFCASFDWAPTTTTLLFAFTLALRALLPLLLW